MARSPFLYFGFVNLFQVAAAAMFSKRTRVIPLVGVSFLGCQIGDHAKVAAQSPTAQSSKQSTIDDRFYINTVRSTSLSTPGAAALVPESDTVAVSGKIVGVDGQPAVGVDVWAASEQLVPPVRELVKSDSKGNFQLQLLPETDWSIRAFQGSRSVNLTRDQSFNMDASDIQMDLNGKLKENCQAQVQILNNDGGALPDARVYLDDGRILVSDKLGHVDLSGLERGIHHAVILARDYVLEEMSIYCDPAIENSNRVRLKRASNVFGTVTTTDGKPVANAWVSRHARLRESLAGDGTYLLADAQGRFAGAYTPASEVADMRELLDHPHEIIRAGAPEFLSKYVTPLSNTVTVSAPFEIVLNENQSRDVLNKETIKTPGGSRILMQSFSPAETEEKPTDGMLRGLSASRDQVLKKTDKSGMPSIFGRFAEMNESQKFQRRVVGSDGLPIEGVRVEPYKDDFFGSFGMFEDESPKTQYTDKFGIVSVSPQPGMGDLLFSHEGYANKLITVHELEEDSNDIELEPRRVLKASVVDDSGAILEDFEVTLLRIQPNSGSHMSMSGRLPREPIVLQCSNDRGEFYFSDDLTNQGQYRVTIRAKGQTRLVDEIDFSKLAVGTTSERTFKLERANSLILNVSSAKGSGESNSAIADAKIAIFNEADFVERKVNPFYSMLKLALDPNEIHSAKSSATIQVSAPLGTMAIQAPGFARQFFEWQTSVAQYDVALVPESVIAGVIETGTAPSEAKHSTYALWVASFYDRYVIHEQVADSFEIPNLSTGWYRVMLSDGTRTLVRSDVFVKSGERIDLQYKFNSEGLLKLSEKKSSGSILGDNIQFTVNGKPKRYKSVDEYLVAIKEHVAMRSESFAETLTKDRLFEAMEESVYKFENPGGNLPNRPEFRNVIKMHPALKELAHAEQWPDGIMIYYNDQNDQPFIALAVPTPNETSLEQVLLIGF